MGLPAFSTCGRGKALEAGDTGDAGQHAGRGATGRVFKRVIGSAGGFVSRNAERQVADRLGGIGIGIGIDGVGDIDVLGVRGVSVCRRLTGAGSTVGGVGAVAGVAFAMLVRDFLAAPLPAPFVPPVEASVGALGSAPVGRREVRSGAVTLGPCARTARRVRLDRSGRLKHSHGSRLFEGEGPTGEDNAARAAGPPTG
ncbi:hypothetical protein ACGF07_32270 [Kitasatospora sp. NPDC048194]|uniref:hypothetical protein n=1 Tax=Kitasatospora sp. NPDC048194 TaxID=3364045 RepID=UPI0037163DCF